MIHLQLAVQATGYGISVRITDRVYDDPRALWQALAALIPAHTMTQSAAAMHRAEEPDRIAASGRAKLLIGLTPTEKELATIQLLADIEAAFAAGVTVVILPPAGTAGPPKPHSAGAPNLFRNMTVEDLGL